MVFDQGIELLVQHLDLPMYRMAGEDPMEEALDHFPKCRPKDHRNNESETGINDPTSDVRNPVDRSPRKRHEMADHVEPVDQKVPHLFRSFHLS